MRDLIEVINLRFEENHNRALDLLGKASDDVLFRRPEGLENSYVPVSFGENIIRSAAVVEMAFGGITTRLWDDPFEWTLPEELSTIERVRDYIDDVAESRKNGMAFLQTDEDLRRVTPAPESLRTILDILIGAISQSSTHLGQAAAILYILNARAKHFS